MALGLAVRIGGADGLAGAGRQPAPRPAPTGDECRTAVFAGVGFWCVEEAFDKVAGGVETTSGYTGGTVPDPSYEQVSAGGTGHAEAVQVRYDPAKVGYAALLDRSEEHTSELQSLMRISYAVFCLKKKKHSTT